MAFSFLSTWAVWIWDGIKSFDYSFVLDGTTYVANYFLTTVHNLLTSDQSVTRFIDENDVFYNKKPIRKFFAYIVTWNVKSKPCPAEQRLLNLLSLAEDYARPEESVPDMYAIGLQEASGETWRKSFLSILGKRNYVLIKTKVMAGLILFCFVKREHLLNVRKIDSSQTHAGILGIKGTVSIRLCFSGCTLCLANSHFNRDKVEERIDDYNGSVNDHPYNIEHCPDILSHDIVLWFGDFNFRLNVNNKATAEDINELIQLNERDKLLKMDELRYLMNEGTVFKDFVEKAINFPPSYKFDANSHYYNLSRKPAWTDRILYKLKPNPYTNLEFKIKQGIYYSRAECDMSDHRPVVSEYFVEFVEFSSEATTSAALTKRKMKKEASSGQDVAIHRFFEDPSRLIVEFEDIIEWNADGANSIEYTLPAGFTEHPGSDWICLFRNDFYDLAKHIAYEQVPNYSQITTQTSIADTDTTYLNNIVSKKRKLTLDFSEQAAHIVDGTKYVLVYIEREKSGVMGVAGISNSFVAKKVAEPVEIKEE